MGWLNGINPRLTGQCGMIILKSINVITSYGYHILIIFDLRFSAISRYSVNNPYFQLN